ncbi:MAG: TM2 domain-containing protein [Erysipelotrichaceae bacterium]|nr:TM2 domain-containing protein [Erysipelotrichaceae bacterium]
MDYDKVELYLMNNQKYFKAEVIESIREDLLDLDDDSFLLAPVTYRDPVLLLVISILGGVFGIDRFLIGDIGMGFLKLVTGGLCGLLAVIDWIIIMNRTKDYNYRQFQNAIQNYRY